MHLCIYIDQKKPLGKIGLIASTGTSTGTSTMYNRLVNNTAIAGAIGVYFATRPQQKPHHLGFGTDCRHTSPLRRCSPFLSGNSRQYCSTFYRSYPTAAPYYRLAVTVNISAFDCIF